MVWIDLHEDKKNYVDIDIRIEDIEDKSLSYVIKVQFGTNRVSIQGSKYNSFIQEVFPDVLKKVDELISTSSSNSSQTAKISTTQQLLKESVLSTEDSRLPSKRKLSNISSNQQNEITHSFMSNITADIASIQSSFQKMELSKLLETVISNQRDLDKRLLSMQEKLSAQRHTCSSMLA